LSQHYGHALGDGPARHRALLGVRLPPGRICAGEGEKRPTPVGSAEHGGASRIKRLNHLLAERYERVVWFRPSNHRSAQGEQHFSLCLPAPRLPRGSTRHREQRSADDRHQQKQEQGEYIGGVMDSEVVQRRNEEEVERQVADNSGEESDQPSPRGGDEEGQKEEQQAFVQQPDLMLEGGERCD
jgi:hypothetical protein